MCRDLSPQCSCYYASLYLFCLSHNTHETALLNSSACAGQAQPEINYSPAGFGAQGIHHRPIHEWCCYAVYFLFTSCGLRFCCHRASVWMLCYTSCLHLMSRCLTKRWLEIVSNNAVLSNRAQRYKTAMHTRTRTR